LPANIYFPAIPKMAEAFHVSTELLNQTVTAYLAMQGICASLFIFWSILGNALGPSG
jgi:hypothetical protein